MVTFSARPGMGKTCSMAKLALDWKPGNYFTIKMIVYIKFF